MRVYLGSDHAGFELKNEIIEHLKKNGHEPIDCGAYTYDAEDDYPAFCIAAALKTVGDNESLGIVIGGSGNGEQIAANKVPGARCALAWSTETASLARRAQQRAADRHRRAHAHRARGAGDRRRVPDHGVVESRAAPTSYRHPDEVRGDARAAARAGRAGLGMPEGHTLHRLARLHQRRFGRAPVIVSSPQGRFADGAAAVSGRVLKKASAWGKHLFHHYEGGRVVHVHLGLYGTFSEVRAADAAAGGAGADADGRRGVRHRSARPDGVRGDRRAGCRRRGGAARSRPVATRRRRGSGVGANHQVPQADRCTADGSDGDRRRRQRVSQRVAVPSSHRPVPAGRERSVPTNSTPCGRIWSS